MKTVLSPRAAAFTMLLLFLVILFFHALILAGIIPFDTVWGGKLKTREEMLVFESISVVLNLLMMGVVAVKGGYWKLRLPPKWITILLWCMAVLFLVNTLGNLFANNLFEQVLGTLLTITLAMLSLRLALAS
jgi:hypothetical protein